MEAGKAAGWMYVTSEAVRPDAIAEGQVWRVYDDQEKRHCDAPNVSISALPPMFGSRGSEADEALLLQLVDGMLPEQKVEVPAAFGFVAPLEHVRALVLERLQSLRRRFPSASEDQLASAIVTYSPESYLHDKGHKSAEAVPDAHWEKYQGPLQYGTDQEFHNGVAAVLGDDIVDDGEAFRLVVQEVLQLGGPGDRYNLWYIQYCPAVEQKNYDEKGELRSEGSTQKPKVLDAGHAGMRLRDFTSMVNRLLEEHGSGNRTTEVRVLALRLYTASTFRRFNASLRTKGMGKVEGSMDFRACVQSARKCVLDMQAIARAHANTYRGVTGFLASSFESRDMGMDYAFFSTSADEGVATEFAGSADHSVVFEVEYMRACAGADVSPLSVYPGEKEVLFPPCTGLSLAADDGKGARTGEDAGQARVRVYPAAAK